MAVVEGVKCPSLYLWHFDCVVFLGNLPINIVALTCYQGIVISWGFDIVTSLSLIYVLLNTNHRFCVVSETCCAPTFKLNQAFCFQLDDLCFSCVPPSMMSGLCWVHPYYFILLYGSLASLRSSCVKRCLFCCSSWKLSVTFFFFFKFSFSWSSFIPLL